MNELVFGPDNRPLNDPGYTKLIHDARVAATRFVENHRHYPVAKRFVILLDYYQYQVGESRKIIDTLWTETCSPSQGGNIDYKLKSVYERLCESDGLMVKAKVAMKEMIAISEL